MDLNSFRTGNPAEVRIAPDLAVFTGVVLAANELGWARSRELES